MNQFGSDLVCSGVPQRYKDKYEFLAKKICARTKYIDYSEGDGEVDWAYCYMNGPMLDGEGFCQAYAQAYLYLGHRAGLWCVCAVGDCHARNVVKLEDGSTYHVDVTRAYSEYLGFDDSHFLLTQEETEESHTHENIDYIMATGNK